MKKIVKNINTNYIQYGEGKDILLLHGWGQKVEAFRPIIESLKKDFKVYTLDFPGFGRSEEPKTIWSVYDYADMVEKFVKELEIKNPTIFGHSFGGRVAIRYSSLYNVNKTFLVSAKAFKNKSINSI